MLPSIFGESLFDDWMGFPFRGFESDVDRKLYGKHAAHVMKTDLKEHDEGYELKVDLPGFKKGSDRFAVAEWLPDDYRFQGPRRRRQG